MRTKQDVEAFLLRMDRRFSEASESTYVVDVANHQVFLRVSEPLVLARVELGKAPTKGREKLYEHLLRLNATTLVQASYGLDGDTIVLATALVLENLDYNELDAMLAEFDLALAQQLPEIRRLADELESRD